GSSGEKARSRELLKDPDPLVRLRVAQGFLGANDKTALPVLIDCLQSLPWTLQAWQAEELLRWVAWDDSPSAVIGSGNKAARSRCHAAWKTWWEKGAANVELPPRSKERRRPTLIICQHHLSGFELVGCDGTTRWEIRIPASRVEQLIEG